MTDARVCSVGGGKLVRSRYSEDMTKWMVAALREIGFSEDRSAAETYDSQVVSCLSTESTAGITSACIYRARSSSSTILGRI
jgi:hypothetical protein